MLDYFIIGCEVSGKVKFLSLRILMINVIDVPRLPGHTSVNDGFVIRRFVFVQVTSGGIHKYEVSLVSRSALGVGHFLLIKMFHMLTCNRTLPWQ
jgi:hypothetical protein